MFKSTLKPNINRTTLYWRLLFIFVIAVLFSSYLLR